MQFSESCKIELFEHDSYGGVKDMYDSSTGLVRRNDDMSSLKVSPGCCVTVYEHGTMEGKPRNIARMKITLV